MRVDLRGDGGAGRGLGEAVALHQRHAQAGPGQRVGVGRQRGTYNLHQVVLNSAPAAALIIWAPWGDWS